MTSSMYRMGRLALAGGALTMVAMFGSAGLAAAATTPSAAAIMASHTPAQMRGMTCCQDGCCQDVCCAPPRCDALPWMSAMSATRRPATVTTDRPASRQCGCCEHTPAAVPAAPAAGHDMPSCTACRHDSKNAA